MRLRFRWVSCALGAALVVACAEQADPEFEGFSDQTGGSGGTSGGNVGKGGTQPIAGSSAGGKGGSTSGGATGSGGTTAGSFGNGGSAGSSGNGGSAGGGGTGGVPQDVIDRAEIELRYQTTATQSPTNTIFMKLFIVNLSADPLPLGFTTVRYWFDADGNTPVLQHFHMGNRVTGQSEVLGEEQGHAYAEVRFTGTTIVMGGDINGSEFQLQFTGGAYTLENDWSWDGSATAHVPNEKMTVYLDGQRIWGCEPYAAGCLGGDGGAAGAAGAGGEPGAGGAGGEPGVGGAGGEPGAGGAGGQGGLAGAVGQGGA